METPRRPKQFTVTWHEEREVVVFAKTEDMALIIAATMDGNWVKRDQYKAREMNDQWI